MKILFLDIDGVIAVGYTTMKEYKWGRLYKFDKKAVKVLNEILEVTGAEIVLSSDWKTKFDLNDMREIFEWCGVIRGPISFTPNSIYYKDGFLEGGRAYEIMEWLKVHDVHNKLTWVAIDDLNLLDTGNYQFFEDKFVHCPKWNEGIKQSGIKKKIIDVLNT